MRFLKIIIKKIVPKKYISSINRLRLIRKLKLAFLYDYKQYLNYSNTYPKRKKEFNIIGNIIADYHVIEKGLTMPSMRLGFGQQKLRNLIMHCLNYINTYGLNDEQLLHAISVIKEYIEVHEEQKYKLEKETLEFINILFSKTGTVSSCSQKEINKDEYFKFSNANFTEFSNSRSSVRNYSDVIIPINLINNSIDLAKNTPSACNRQCWRTYVYSDKDKLNEILSLQGGNRGFGHLANKLIVITAEVGVFLSIGERHEAYIDGGMYAMNLLYALHHNKLAACILNCSHDVEKDKKMRKICDIKDSEVFIAMISCGYPSENFKIPLSKRYSIEKTNTIIN